MGSQRSGNRNPKKRANPKDKSINLSVRLNPRKEHHRWALEYVRQFQHQQNQLPEDERWGMGDLFTDALMVRAGIERTEPTVIASAGDIADIKSIVQYLMDKIESGELGTANNGGGRRKKRETAAQLSEGMRTTIDRYISNGFVGADDLDEDE